MLPRSSDKKLPPENIILNTMVTTPAKIRYPVILWVVIEASFCSMLIRGAVSIVTASLVNLLASE